VFLLKNKNRKKEGFIGQVVVKLSPIKTEFIIKI